MRHADSSIDQSEPRLPSPDGEVCGYRVLRRLHTGERTQAFLARDGAGDHVVLRVFPGANGSIHARDELDLSARVWSEHVQRALDVGCDVNDSPVLVCERLGGRLSELLSSGGYVAAGSLVTLAAPLVAALRDLHENGIAHGAVDVAHVRLAEDGRPVLVGADEAMPTTPAAARADLDGLAHLIAVVLHHCDEHTRSRGVSEITSWLEDQCSTSGTPSPELYADLECRIFALAPPLPFAVGQERVGTEQRVDARRTRTVRERGQTSTLTALLDGELTFSLSGVVSACCRIGSAFRASPRARRLAIIVVAVFVASLAGALWLVPQSSSADAPSPTAVAQRPSPEPAAAATLAPLDALGILLTARAECRHSEASPDCLDVVYEARSPSRLADRAALMEGTADPFPLLSLDAHERVLGSPERTGGAVTVSLARIDDTSQSVSVLLVKTETGWLIRDVFDA